MRTDIVNTKAAWEFDAYAFWCKHTGQPEEVAKKCLENPTGMLKKYAQYFDTYDGIQIANICGSCGKKAVPLSLLGSQVTVFDLSQQNRRYAIELANAAHTTIEYVVGDVMDIDIEEYGGRFDVVFMEGGILHYFHDIHAFMILLKSLLGPSGKLICSDFHPFTKVFDSLEVDMPSMDYFSTEIFQGEMAHARFYPEDIRKHIPKCRYRKYTMSEIVNAVIESGFSLKRLDEHPAWTNEKLPGEFTIVALKQ